MTGTGGEVTRPEEDRRAGDTGAEQGSLLQQYRKRVEEWASSLRDGVEQHAPPEVLTGLASTVKQVAQYLDDMAERARVKQAELEAAPEPEERTESASKD